MEKQFRQLNQGLRDSIAAFVRQEYRFLLQPFVKENALPSLTFAGLLPRPCDYDLFLAENICRRTKPVPDMKIRPTFSRSYFIGRGDRIIRLRPTPCGTR